MYEELDIHEETEDKCKRRRRRIDDVGEEYDGEANNLLNSCTDLGLRPDKRFSDAFPIGDVTITNY